MITKLITIAIAIMLTFVVIQTNAYASEEIIPNAVASHGTDEASCEGDGLYDGKNNPFSQELYDMCGDTYYQTFIEGCMSVEGNTEDVCESAADAGE